MNTIFIVFYITSLIVWIIVPIRHIKGTFFLFFLALIGGDIVTIIARFVFHSKTNIFYVISGLLCLISIQDKNISKLSKILLLSLCLISLALELYDIEFKQEFFKQQFSIMNLVDFLIFLKFLKIFIFKLVNEKSINFFLICLIFYQLTALIKILNFIGGAANASEYFIITTFFEIFIGLFFCIFKDDDPRIMIKLKNIYTDS
ncbi:MAG: hypothetical protein WCA84_17715 [Ignavibacteriaceae bacterium]|jgi:hypothetical protein